MQRLRINSTYLLLMPLLATSFGACPKREIHVQAIRLADSLNPSVNVAPITRAQVNDWVDTANETWDFWAGTRFVFDASSGSADFATWGIEVLNSPPDGVDEDFQYDLVGNFIAQVFYPNSAVVYFRAFGGGGWSWGPPSKCFVSMPSWTNTCIGKPNPGQCNPNPTLLSHELGHYFGLPHTFGTATGVDSNGDPVLICADVTYTNMDGDAGGQDGSTTEDDVTDTHADLTGKCLSIDCGTNPVTVNSQSWYIPWKNVMSYHDCYTETLSVDQANVIRRTLEHPKRKALVGG